MKKKIGLTVKQLRTAVKSLKGVEIKGSITLPMRDDIRLTIGGVVMIPGFGWLHPHTFRDVAGEEAYQELLRRPRVICEYDLEDFD